MENQNVPKTLWNRSYIALLILGFISATAYSMVTPVLPKYAVSLGSSLTIAGTLSGMMSITALVMRPVAGLLSDRLNRKKIMVLATFGIGLSVLGYSVSSSMPLLFLFRILHGSAFAISSTANMAFASTFIPDKNMGEGLGWLGLGSILSQAFGPSLGLELGATVGYKYAFILAGVMAIVAAVGMIFVPYSFVPSTEIVKRKIALRDLIEVKLIPYAVLIGMFSLANGLVASFIALLGEERGISSVSLFFTANAISMLAIRPIAGKLTDKKGLDFVLYPAYICAATAMFLVAGANAVWMVVLAGVIKANGQGTGQPSIQAACIKRVGRERSGVAISTCYIGQDLGQGIGPTLGGAIASSFGYGAMYGGAGVLLLGCMLLFFVVRRREKRLGIS